MWFYPQKFNIAQLDLISKTTTYEKILFDALTSNNLTNCPDNTHLRTEDWDKLFFNIQSGEERY